MDPYEQQKRQQVDAQLQREKLQRAADATYTANVKAGEIAHAARVEAGNIAQYGKK